MIVDQMDSINEIVEMPDILTKRKVKRNLTILTYLLVIMQIKVARAEEKSPPNIVVIIVDDLGKSVCWFNN